MDEYKGIYYGDDSEKKFFEGGAHFKYSKLYKRLEQIALERKEKEKEKEKDLYIHKKKNLINLLNNNNIHNFDNSTKEKKSRNIQSCFNNNLTNSSMTNNTKNKTFNNIVFFKYNQKKANNNNNDSLMNNKTNYYQTYIIVKNKGKDNLNQKPKIIDIKKKKKMNISRNKISSVIFKARPNTILKDGMKNILLFGKNNLIFKSMEQETKNKKVPIENLNKRSFPNLNNMINMNKFKKVQTNASFLEFNKIRVKTERNKNVGIAEKWNKSQNNFNLIKIRLKSISSKNDGNKIKKKNYIVNDNKKIKETSKSKLTNYIYKNIMEQFNLKTGKEGEEKSMKKTVKVEGMMCPHCEASVKKALEAIDGIDEAVVSHEKGTAEITLSKDVEADVIQKAIEDRDYKFCGIE
jgi:copper chaperone CopZ